MSTAPQNNATIGILFVLAGVFFISINDMLIKQLSGGYPLHQMVFTRSIIGIMFSLIFVQMEGGWRILRTNQPGLHVLRGLLIVTSNMTFFVALAAIPLADATALFFAAPLFITLLSIPILGEKVGPLRLGAVIFGFLGVVIMQRPWEGVDTLGTSRLILLLPVRRCTDLCVEPIADPQAGCEKQSFGIGCVHPRNVCRCFYWILHHSWRWAFCRRV